MAKTSLVWLRNDLRIADNLALSAAVTHGDRVIAFYVHEKTTGIRQIGGAGRWWLHQSLVVLGAALAERGIELEVASGETRQAIDKLVKRSKAEAVFWNRRYAPGERAVDEAVEAELRQRGLYVESFGANVLVEPWDIATGQGRPYSVYSPFLKALKASSIPTPERMPKALKALEAKPVDADYRKPRWAQKLTPYWQIGEAAAEKALSDFLEQKLSAYPLGRDIPGQSATSRLSPHLRFGEISPRRAWHAALAVAHADPGKQAFVDKFLSELAWRDFNYHQLFHRDDIVTKSMQPRYEGMGWREAPVELAAWKMGQTGVPIVDAGMREMWETGFMQNRVRMLTASFLTKNLLVDWRLGEAWFWDCLMDADMANNPGNWQWVAGSGLDAAPFFRIFNPVTQGEKFDTDGSYVRQWVPELAKLPDKWVHRPSEAPREVLVAAGVNIGKNYPRPIVDLKESRERALEAMAAL
jgi:deoxyribodipyrimidine photo-lyase